MNRYAHSCMLSALVITMLNASETPLKNSGVLFINNTGHDGAVFSVGVAHGAAQSAAKSIKKIVKDGSEIIAIPDQNVGVFFDVNGFKSQVFMAKDLNATASITFRYKPGKPTLVSTLAYRKTDVKNPELEKAHAANSVLQEALGACNTRLRQSETENARLKARVEHLEKEVAQVKSAKS